MGKPSHDRVRFFLSAHRVTTNREQFRQLLDFAFDMCLDQFMSRVGMVNEHHCEGVVIECRPAQFARFMIRRNELGLTNSFKDLAPRLFVPRQPESLPFIDVSKRAHKDPRMGHGCAADDEEQL